MLIGLNKNGVLRRIWGTALGSLLLAGTLHSAKAKASSCYELLIPILKPISGNASLPTTYTIEFPKAFEKLFQSRTEARLNIQVQGKISHSFRIELKPEKIAHEIWAANFISEYGDIQVPKHRFLSTQETKDFLKILKKQNLVAYYLLQTELAQINKVEFQPEIEILPSRMSVSDWVPNAQPGHSALPSRGDMQETDDILLRQNIREKINSIHPGLTSKLDKALVMTMILGIWDFHSMNWLLDSNKSVWMIDFTSSDLNSIALDLYDGLFQPLMFHPYLEGKFDLAFDDAWDTEEILIEAIQSLDSKTLKKLKGLTKPKIIEDAKKFGFTLSPEKAKRIHKRIKFILEIAQKSTPAANHIPTAPTGNALNLPKDYNIRFPIKPESLFNDNVEARMEILLPGDKKNPVASVRIEIEPKHLAHEVFVSDFFREVGELNVPRIRELTGDEIKDFVVKLKKQDPHAYSLMIDQLAMKRNLSPGKGPRFPERMTITEWIPGVRDGESLLGPYKRELEVANPLNPNDQKKIQALLEKVAPGSQRFLDRAFIMAVLFGVYDFHSGNWLLDKSGNVWIIDFSLSDVSNAYFLESNADLFIEQSMHPYLTQSINTTWGIRELVAMSVPSLSPEVIEKLGNLDRKKLKEMAKSSGFNLEDKKIDLLLKRMEFVYNLATNPK